MNFERLIKESPILKIGVETCINFFTIIVIFVLCSFIFLNIINKNNTIIPLYVGIVICFIVSKEISKYLKFINKNSDYNKMYDLIKNSPITNYSKPIEKAFVKVKSLTTFFSKTVSGKNDITEKNYNWICPNVFFVILVFCYCYLLFCFSFTLNVSNSTKTPQIIQFFNFMMICFIILYTILSILQLITIYKKTQFIKIKTFEFILRIGIYNLLISFFIGLIISIIYFNIVKTFFKKNLFFQNRKLCFCKKDDKDCENLCYYEPSNINWGYKF